MSLNSLLHPALLVVDMQRYFLDPGARAELPRGAEIIPRVCSLIEAFRGAQLPVAFTRHAHGQDELDGRMGRWWNRKLPIEGDPESELIPAIAPRPGEILITKTRYSAFEGTDLDAQLRSRGALTLVLCGIQTHLCVETTARHAFMKEFQTVVVGDACAAKSDAYHEAALLNLSHGFALIESTSAVREGIRQISRG